MGKPKRKSADQAAAVENKVPKKKYPELPPCRVCGSSASGYHFGVISCEACKVVRIITVDWFDDCQCKCFLLQKYLIKCFYFYVQVFFRRYLQNNTPYICALEEKCEIKPDRKGTCSYCRLQKCIAEGMSKDCKYEQAYFLCIISEMFLNTML